MTTVLIGLGVLVAIPVAVVLAYCVVSGVRNVVAESPQRRERLAQQRADRKEALRDIKRDSANRRSRGRDE